MVVALGPGKFYGSSLPRPRIYTDVKLNDERVDPPLSVLDPLLSWAEEAHWSMGGLSFKRHRLQGRIEGSIKKLRAERESFIKKRTQISAAAAGRVGSTGKGSTRKNVTPSPPPAPMVNKRRRLLIDEDEDSEADEESERKNGGVGVRVSRRSVRKLGDDFDRVAVESGLGKSRRSPAKNSGDGSSENVAARTRSRRSEKVDEDGGIHRVKMVEKVNKPKSKGKTLEGNGKANRGGENGGSTSPSGTRTSPRLLKRELF